ncbi:MAG: WD40 repeat domain-containing protein [Anaerolineae bacterium]
MTTTIMSSHVRTPGPKVGLVVMTITFFITAFLLVAAFFAVPSNIPISNPNPDAAALSAAFAPLLADANDHLLVWVGNGTAPGKHSASNPGQLAWMDGTGLAEPLMDVPPQTSRVQACGDASISPDGQQYAFYVGLDAGSLYIMHGSDQPIKLDDVNALTCVGSGTFQFSPNSSRIGYIAYEADAAGSEFPDGFLKVRNVADQSEAFRYENVTAFDLTDDGAAFVSFFTNDKNEADEAAVMWWDGSSQQEVATLKPASEDCKFTSASVAILPDGKLLLVMGHRCKKGDTSTNWQLYAVNPTERSATLAASASQPGAFAAFARTNVIFVSPAGDRAYFMVPDGIESNTAGLKAVNLGDLSLTDVVDKQLVAATYSGGANAFPRLSPDGKWLAAVMTSPNNENTLQIWNLADSNVAPISLSAGSRGDTVSSMAFTPDGSKLMAVIGGDNTANNSLIAVELATGRDLRVARGHFGPGLTISPDGNGIALLDWQIPEDTKEPPYANLITVEAASGATTTLFAGADIQDGKVVNQRFALPMLWLKSGAAATSG